MNDKSVRNIEINIIFRQICSYKSLYSGYIYNKIPLINHRNEVNTTISVVP